MKNAACPSESTEITAENAVVKQMMTSPAPVEPTPAEPDAPKKKRQSRRQANTLCKGQRLRLLPTPEQAALLQQWINHSRYVWNWALEQQTKHHEQYLADETNGQDMTGRLKRLIEAELSKQLTLLRKQTDFAWLNECPFTVLNMALQHLKTSWTAFYEGLSGKRADQPGKPQFHARQSSNQQVSFQIDARLNNVLDVDNSTIKIPGLGPVGVVLSESVAGDISSVSVKRKGKKWYVSLTLINVKQEDACRQQQQNGCSLLTDGQTMSKAQKKQLKKYLKKQPVVFPNNPTDTQLNLQHEGLAALDLSVVSGAVATQDGKTTIALFGKKVLRSDEHAFQRKAKYQRAYSRKQEILYASAGIKRDKDGRWPKGASKILRAQGKPTNTKRMQTLQEKIAICDLHEVFRRSDAIHKFTTNLVRNNHTIVVETLMLHAMAQSLSRGFRRRMHEACMGEIIRQLRYKCAWYNRSLIFVDKWFPSSKRCSNPACHEKNKHLLLKDRLWVCTSCNTTHVRDDNASFNLWQEGWRLLDLLFQQNNTDMLAAGSVVRGTQGVIFEALPVKKQKPQKNLSVQSEQSDGALPAVA